MTQAGWPLLAPEGSPVPCQPGAPSAQWRVRSSSATNPGSGIGRKNRSTSTNVTVSTAAEKSLVRPTMRVVVGLVESMPHLIGFSRLSVV